MIATTEVIEYATSMSPTLVNTPSGLATAFADSGLDAMVHVPRQAHRLAGFRDWVLGEDFPEKLKATYLGGEVYLDMSKEDINAHALVKTEVGGVIRNLNEEVDFGHLFINGVLVTNRAARVSNNPDAVAVFWDSLASGRVRYVEYHGRALEILGSPDWTMEIVSDSSVFKDTQQLREAYHLARIKEYWLIDARGAELDFQLMVWRKSGYVAAPSRDGWVRSPLFKRSFRLTRRRDRSGAWKYRLEMK